MKPRNTRHEPQKEITNSYCQSGADCSTSHGFTETYSTDAIEVDRAANIKPESPICFFELISSRTLYMLPGKKTLSKNH